MNNNKGNSINAGFAQHLINNNNNDEQFHNSAPNINVGGLNITIEGNSGISSISPIQIRSKTVSLSEGQFNLIFNNKSETISESFKYDINNINNFNLGNSLGSENKTTNLFPNNENENIPKLNSDIINKGDNKNSLNNSMKDEKKSDSKGKELQINDKTKYVFEKEQDLIKKEKAELLKIQEKIKIEYELLRTKEKKIEEKKQKLYNREKALEKNQAIFNEKLGKFKEKKEGNNMPKKEIKIENVDGVILD